MTGQRGEVHRTSAGHARQPHYGLPCEDDRSRHCDDTGVVSAICSVMSAVELVVVQASTTHSGNTLTDSTQSVHTTMKPKLFHSSQMLTEVNAEGTVMSQTALENTNTGAMDVEDKESCTKDGYSDQGACIKDQAKNGNPQHTATTFLRQDF